MKQLLYLMIILCSQTIICQNNSPFAVEVSLLRGNILPHTEDMYHLINAHPNGLMVSLLHKTDGSKEWHRAFNYPDFGAYFLYQDFNSTSLGQNYAAGALYNFYFWKRRFQFRLGQGIAMTNNPYDKEDNSKNKSFGTRFMANTNFGLNYVNQNVIKNVGFQAGILFAHYSNGRIKSPNSGINSYLLNFGVNYNIGSEFTRQVDTTLQQESYKEPIRYNFVFRTGVNESPIIRSGQHPFYHIGFYADKRINRKSTLQLGTELFLTKSLKDYINYFAIAYPEKKLDPNTDYKRVGVFVGHELMINKISLEAQLGFYVYQPFKKDIAIYDRIGMKYRLTDKVSAGLSLKTHLFLAEALEVGIGYRI